MRTGGLVLAAGAGTRFHGGIKQVAELRGRPLLEHAIAAIDGLAPRIVVLGHEAEAVRARVDLQGACAVECRDWEQGQAASLRCGIAALGDVDAAVVVLGDQPFITRPAVEALVAAARGSDADALRGAYGGRPGHPVLLRRALLDRAGELQGDSGFRSLLERARVEHVDLGHLADPADIDTREELAAR